MGSSASVRQKSPHNARAGNSSPAIAAGLLVTLLTLGAPGSAAAQGIPQDMQDALQRKYDILQQQSDTERKRAESERMRAEAEIGRNQGPTYPSVGNTSASSQTHVVSVDRGSLGGINAPTYRMGNGIILQVTGGFWPYAPTVCIAHCQ